MYRCRYPMALPHCKPGAAMRRFLLEGDRWLHQRQGRYMHTYMYIYRHTEYVYTYINVHAQIHVHI